ncbi:sulfide dehydrogenase [Mycoplana dimorpha]|uniref:Sulfite dehydrogenase (Cytochrome) subunit SorB n=1 Tax=Mycoplana dimorpha TaxID=28320 RepID=A0A2T5AM04_MYCDI|nr:sulfide dehydrogenase [Mycoplana dimorpha]PTM87757.1 sulfite dehydrogenase (cytochrome) subunit SorB [Mycoplana dimorpha]
MPVRREGLLIVAVFAAFSFEAKADSPEFELKAGSNLDVVEQNCAACHSLEYIEMNSPFLDQTGWAAEVTKMVKAFGAPIETADQQKIMQYLTTNYGKK